MQNVLRLTMAAILTGSMATAALAQAKSRNAAKGAPRAQNAPNLVSDPYGERPRSPGAEPGSQRPFAIGCDKRGFW